VKRPRPGKCCLICGRYKPDLKDQCADCYELMRSGYADAHPNEKWWEHRPQKGETP